MNFFKLYIGDYQRDTAHLSVTEHGAFMLMLQTYYATEKPLPTGKTLHRMLRAQDKAEREAIDSVASQFWTVTQDGLINERADQEIAKARVHAEKNSATAKAREAARKAARDGHEQSTNRATTCEPIHSHSHNHSQSPNGDVVPPAAGEQQQRPANVVELPTPADRTGFAKAVAQEYAKAYGIEPPPVPLMLAMEIAARVEFYPPAGDLSWWGNYFSICWEDLFLTDRSATVQPLGRKAANFRYLVSEKCMADLIDRSKREAVHG